MFSVKRFIDGFRIFMYPTQFNLQNFKIKFIDIQRASNGNQFEGIEAEVSVKDNNVKGNFGKIKISKV